MPTSASSKKRLRQNLTRQARNKSIKSNLRHQVRKVLVAAKENDAEATEAQFRLAVKKLDQAAAKKVIHANKAARTKSRLVRAIKAAKS